MPLSMPAPVLNDNEESHDQIQLHLVQREEREFTFKRPVIAEKSKGFGTPASSSAPGTAPVGAGVAAAFSSPAG